MTQADRQHLATKAELEQELASAGAQDVTLISLAALHLDDPAALQALLDRTEKEGPPALRALAGKVRAWARA
jgi:hypothetical protein